MRSLPSGTVTFLFTDIEGSTERWERDRITMAAAVDRHLALLRTAIDDHGGVLFKTVGDAVQAAFPTVPAAIATSLAAQRALLAEDWGEIGALRVRMAVHAGEAEPDAHGDYLATPLNRLARLLATGHGGQILLTQTVQQLSRGMLPDGATLRDLGEHRLRDLLDAEHVYQVLHPDVPATFTPLTSLDARPNNLPRQPTPFMGREQEVAEVVALLRREDIQLVTLTGTGGTGKTRLALQAAAELLADNTDGVFFVPLAPLTETDLVLSTIAVTLGIRKEGGQPLLARLRDAFATQQLLLILDNIEHLVRAAPSIGELVATAPGLKVLVTSRMPLRLRAEHEYLLPPLGMPHRDPPPTAAQLSQFEAVRLFIARAQAVKPDFAIDNDNAPAIAEICWRLDGLPLAIELAAARVRLLSPQMMLTRLEQRLPFLTGGARDAPERQRTIRNTVAWSYDLLQPEDQTLFQRLAVFAGGCTLEAAEAVTNPDGDLDVFGGMERLGEHSLLRQGGGGEPRFAMLETVREYALELLVASGDEDALRERHAGHFATLGDHMEQESSLRPVPFLATLGIDADNLQAALGWAEARRQADLGLRLGLAFAALATQWGALTEGRQWLERVLAPGGGDPSLRARAKTMVGWFALHQGDAEVAGAAAEQAVDIAPAGSWIHALALLLRGTVELDGGPSDAARHWLEEALALVESDTGDAEAKGWTLPVIHNNLGLLASLQGDDGESRRCYEATLAALPNHEASPMRATALGNLAWIAWEGGDRSRAAELRRSALALRVTLQNLPDLADSFVDAASHAAVSGRPEVAAWLLGAATAVWRRGGIVIEPFNLDEHHALVARVRAQLDEPAFDAAWARGETLPLNDAVTKADAIFAEAVQNHGGAEAVTDRPTH